MSVCFDVEVPAWAAEWLDEAVERSFTDLDSAARWADEYDDAEGRLFIRVYETSQNAADRVINALDDLRVPFVAEASDEEEVVTTYCGIGDGRLDSEVTDSGRVSVRLDERGEPDPLELERARAFIWLHAMATELVNSRMERLFEPVDLDDAAEDGVSYFVKEGRGKRRFQIIRRDARGVEVSLTRFPSYDEAEAAATLLRGA